VQTTRSDMIGTPTGRLAAQLLFAACVAVFAVFFAWPVLLTVAEGFSEPVSGGKRSWTLRYVADVFGDPVLRRCLTHSLGLALTVTGLSVLVAMPLAILATRYEFPGKRLLVPLLLVPLVLPPFVGAIGMRHLLGRFGALNSLLGALGIIDPDHPIDFLGGARFWGVVLVQTLYLYPIVYLNVSAALANLDPTMEQAAENLGAAFGLRLRRIILPLILPGMFAGCTIVFIWSFTELGTPLMFDYYSVAPVQVFWGIQEMSTNPRPYALVAVMLSVSAGLYLAATLVFGGRSYAMTTRAMTGEAARRLGPAGGVAAAAFVAAVIAAAVLPHVGVLLTSLAGPGSWYRSVLPQRWTFEHYTGALRHPLAAGSIRNSLFYAGLATLLDIALGFTMAYLSVRVRIRGRRLLDTLAMMPLAVPGLVLAFGYVAMTLRWPFPQLADWCRSHGWEKAAALMQVTGEAPNPAMFLIIAYAMRRLPYVVRSAAAGLSQVSAELEEAAANLGASRIYTVRRVIVPLVIPNLIAGGLLAFSFAMLEVSDSLILAQTEEYYPMTKAIYALFARLGDGPYIASAMGAWGMALLTVTLIGASLMLGRRLGAIFRM